MVLTGFLPISVAASIYLFKQPYAIGLVTSLSGHVMAYPWRSLPRVHRHRVNKPQDSPKRVLPLHHHGPINMRISFPQHPLMEYEVDMFKVSGNILV